VGIGSYEEAGVKDQTEALSAVARRLGATLNLPRDAEVITEFGHFASVLKISDDLAIAVSTDSAGSKTMIASALDRYDTIGFDCMAMNVNDVICVGARPIALVDYLGVHTLDERRTDLILQGLAGAAAEAGVAIPGGEVAQLPDLIGSDGSVPGEERAFDLVGTAIGVLHPNNLILGGEIQEGDSLIGLDSSGIHSNGLTLARKVLLEAGGYGLDEHFALLDRTLGEELLEPTRIYVKAITALWDERIETRGLVHITGDGLANLCRLEAPVGYLVEELPERPPIFKLIHDVGNIDEAELFRVFNMGIGFVVIVPEEQTETALRIANRHGCPGRSIGRVTPDRGRVVVEPVGLEGTLEDGASRFTSI
jgi:phosphoribosylformylglycinamidine cyclo-ligase